MKRQPIRWGVVFAAFLLGCGEREPSRLLWQFRAGGDAPQTEGALPPYITTSPVVANETVYFGCHDTCLYALHAGSGQQRWGFETGDFVDGDPVVAEGAVYVGGRHGRLYALDADTGQLRWRFQAQPPLTAPVAIGSGLVFVSADGVYAVQASNGQLKWTFRHSQLPYPSAPVLVGDTLYVGCGESRQQGKFCALDAQSGDPKWEISLPDRIVGSPVVADGVLYFACGNTHVYGLGLAAKKIVWDYHARTWGPGVAVAQGIIYLGTEAGRLHAVDVKTRTEKWCVTLCEGKLSCPVLAEGVLYVGAKDGHLYALDATTGQQRWKFRNHGRRVQYANGPMDLSGIYRAPTVAGGVVYVGSTDTHVYALDAALKPGSRGHAP